MNVFRLALLIFVGLNLQPTAVRSQVVYTDVHAHLHGLIGRGQADDYRGAARVAIASMDQFGARRMIVMPPPFAPGMPGRYDVETLFEATKDFPGRFAIVAGGGSLNPILVEAARAGSVSEATRRQFGETAEALAARGIVGYGEMTTEHFSLGPQHPFISAPPDHPLLLLLADIAAKHDLPIELHMEAIDAAAGLNSKYRSPPNPAKLVPNIPAFERLLAHNRRARIIWSHVGWDNTGQRTPALMERLFRAHPNLYASTKIAGDSLPTNRIVDRDTPMDPAWRTVIEAFPDRFLVATDQFHVTPGSDRRFPQHAGVARAVLDALPPALARQIAEENPQKVYPRLPRL